MIQVIFGDCRPLMKADVFSKCLEGLSESAKRRVMDAKRSEHRAHRLMYFMMLDALYRKEKGAPLPEIYITDLGKPYIENGPAISIAHDKELVAVAMSESYKELGMDLQSQPNPVMASRVRRRFLTPPFPYQKGEPEIDFMMAHVEGDTVDITPAHSFGTSSTFLCDYVRAEAIMKMSGGGFSDFPRLRDLCAECETALIPMDDVAIGLAYR